MSPQAEESEIDRLGDFSDFKREEPKLLCFPEFQRYNPFREPEWRWVRACQLVKQGKKFSSESDDAETGRALRFVRALANSKDQDAQARLARRMPGLYCAYEIYKTGGATRWLLDSRILAGQSLLEVARATGLSSGVVYLYEAIFFAIHDRLEARDYVQLKVIGRTAFDAITAEDTEVLLKLLAYHGGPLVLEAALPHVLTGLKSDPATLTEEEAKVFEGLRRLVAVLSISDREDPIPKLLELLRQQPGSEQVTERLKAMEEKVSEASAKAKESPDAKAAEHAAESETNRFDPAHMAQVAEFLRQIYTPREPLEGHRAQLRY